MKIIPKRVAVVVVALLSTAGCATNQLRVEYAREVATQGKAAAMASRTFLSRVEAARQDLNIELVSADPACSRSDGTSLVRRAPMLGRGAPARAWLCVPERWLATGISVSRAPIDERFKETLALIGTLSAYAGAVGEIADEKAPDPAKAINDALATALAFQGAVVAVAGAEGGPLPAANDPRVEAVTGLITFLTELQHQANQVRRLRALVAESPGAANPVISALRNEVTRWESSRNRDAAVATVVNQLLLGTLINRPVPLAPEVRRAALRAYYDRVAANQAADLLEPALTNLLNTLEQADRDFRRILVRDPELNERESRRVAELTRQNIVRALERVTALITAFRGA